MFCSLFLDVMKTLKSIKFRATHRRNRTLGLAQRLFNLARYFRFLFHFQRQKGSLTNLISFFAINFKVILQLTFSAFLHEIIKP